MHEAELHLVAFLQPSRSRRGKPKAAFSRSSTLLVVVATSSPVHQFTMTVATVALFTDDSVFTV